ncbi:MAG: hypothetical protein IPO21_16770 [Bacteroidales bacterium]|nr:hypothetical protein [Bacteroidales bacterium]
MKKISLLVLVLIISLGLYAQRENKKRLRKIDLQIQNALINDEFTYAEQLKTEKSLRVELKKAYKKNDSVGIIQLEDTITKLNASQSNIEKDINNSYNSITSLDNKKLDVKKIHKMSKSAFYIDFYNNIIIYDTYKKIESYNYPITEADLGIGASLGFIGYVAKLNSKTKLGINVRSSFCTLLFTNDYIWNVFQVGPQLLYLIKDKRAIETGILIGKDSYFFEKVKETSIAPYVGIRYNKFGVSFCLNFSDSWGASKNETHISSKSFEIRVGGKF